MKTVPFTLAALIGLLCFSAPTQATPPYPFEFKDGDRVVFVGDTFFERETTYGYIETALTSKFPERNVTFRNLGWSADTPTGESRASFDWPKGPAAWLKRLQGQIAELRPSVVFLGYGMASSFDGEHALPTFITQLIDLILAIEESAGESAPRFVLLGPIRHENLGPPFADPARHNARLALYSQVIQEIAHERDFYFLSLYEGLIGQGVPTRPLTENGIHLNAEGYLEAAKAIERGLGWATRDLGQWAQSAAFERLRQSIIRKNRLFFYRWRPQNATYLFGFRKHEQGQNAREIPMFDPLLADAEKEIAALRSLDDPAPEWFSSNLALSAKAKDPEATLPRPSFETHPDFEIQLYAESPLLAKPNHMNFDPQGRLWIASSSIYPQIKPGQPATDKIVVLEDKDHDGVADSSTVFAEGLLIPTGVAPGDGGVYVGQSTQLLHFKDLDGDLKADRRRIVLSSFGVEDTHHILHSLRWGMDGRLYMNQSIYIHSHVETPHGVVRLNSGGILRLRPDNLKLEVFMKGLVNSWGHDFDRWGQSFATDGAGGAGIHYVVPGAMYITYAGARRILQSVSPGRYPKFCGLEIIDSDHFPEAWQGDMITCDFRAHRVVRFSVDPKDSAYLAKESADLIRSKSVDFRPVDIKLGPDGALYIADWSNPIIQHGEVDFRDSRRDHFHGRIWRVTAKNRPLSQTISLLEASNGALLEQLGAANGFNRKQARRVLTERGRDILPDLKAWSSAHASEPDRLAALWLWQSVNTPNPQLLAELLDAQDGRVRAAATRVLGDWLGDVEDPLELLSERIHDPHPRVRVEALRCLSRLQSSRAATLALQALEHEMDPFLDYALWLTINDLAPVWVSSILSGEWSPLRRRRQLEFGLKSIKPELASAVLGRLVKSDTIGRNGQGPWIELIGQAGGPDEVALLFQKLLDDQLDDGASVRALQALTRAARYRRTYPPRQREQIGVLFERPNSEVLIETLHLAGAWKGRIRGAIYQVLDFAAGGNTPPAVRDAAFAALRDIGDKLVVDELAALCDASQALQVRRPATLALAGLDFKKAAPHAIDILSRDQDEAQSLAFWRELLKRKGAANRLRRALPSEGFPQASARAGLRAARESGRSEPELVLALTRSAGLDSGEISLTGDEIKELAATTLRQGNAAHGELVYRRTGLGCVSCHAIGGVGGQVGPDLTSIGASAPVDYLIESMFYPNRKIKEGYHAIIVLTKNDEEYSGVLLGEDGQKLVIRDAANRETTIPKTDIVEQRIGGSLMPSGIIDGLPEQERLDLFRFMAELGKSGPFDASKGNVARAWKALAATHRIEQFGVERIIERGIDQRDWMPLSSLVNGDLKASEMAALTGQLNRFEALVGFFLGVRFQIPTDGAPQLRLTGLEGAKLWIDGQATDPKSVIRPSLSPSLSAGDHTLILRLDPNRMPDRVRVASDDVTFLIP